MKRYFKEKTQQKKENNKQKKKKQLEIFCFEYEIREIWWEFEINVWNRKKTKQQIESDYGKFYKNKNKIRK